MILFTVQIWQGGLLFHIANSRTVKKNTERFEPKNMVLRNYLEAQNDSGTRLSEMLVNYKRNQGQNRLERCGCKNIRRKLEAILAGKM
nr:MAG TPA: hypothetical protein [Caudoviricetes sp.]